MMRFNTVLELLRYYHQIMTRILTDVYEVIRLDATVIVGCIFSLSIMTLSNTASAQPVNNQCFNIYTQTKPKLKSFSFSRNTYKYRLQWINQHIEGLEHVKPQELHVIDHYLKVYWNLLRLVGTNFRIIIIPEGSKITDHEKFKDLKGKALTLYYNAAINEMFSADSKTTYTFDQADGLARYPYCIVKTKKLKSIRSEYQPLIHELGHIIEQLLFTKLEKQLLLLHYHQAKNKLVPFLSTYSTISASEYFAESIVAFARPESLLETAEYDPRSLLTRNQLKRYDKEMFEFIETMIRNRSR